MLQTGAAVELIINYREQETLHNIYILLPVSCLGICIDDKYTLMYTVGPYVALFVFHILFKYLHAFYHVFNQNPT